METGFMIKIEKPAYCVIGPPVPFLSIQNVTFDLRLRLIYKIVNDVNSVR
jgi:hypothetical protein